VKQVAVTGDDFNLLPRYLAWVVGVVDGDALVLNVSRDTLQQDASLRSIRKKLVKFSLLHARSV
jgi:HSP90 family molecular chaperone